MAVTASSIKILWAASAGTCSFLDCEEKLFTAPAVGIGAYTLGEMAHIKGENPGSNRYDPMQPLDQRNHYSNLILLCPNHHTLIDRPENEAEFSVEVLHNYKRLCETRISSMVNDQVVDVASLLKELKILDDANKLVWEKYGPNSDLAQKNPNNEAAHSFWISERLKTIVPNNRKMGQLLQRNRHLVADDDQPILDEYLLHVRSYEEWVHSNADYKIVTRYPTAFANLLGKIANAST